eukprot:g3692.t1 g3692   contig12:2570903-2574182(+)
MPSTRTISALLLLSTLHPTHSKPDTLLTTPPLSTFQSLIHPYSSIFTRSYDPTNPTTSCYTPLYASDIDGDGVVSSDEYVTFVGELSGGEFEVDEVTGENSGGSYTKLPFVLRLNFVYLSCLCQSGGGWNCCKGTEGGIYTTGAGPNDSSTQDEIAYLTRVCGDTQGSIEYVRMKTIMVWVVVVRTLQSPSSMKPSSAAPIMSFEPTTTVPESELVVEATMGACNDTRTEEVLYTIGSTMSICFSTGPNATITSLKNVTASTSGGAVEELVDETGDDNLATTVEGVGTSYVTLDTLITLSYYYGELDSGVGPTVVVEGVVSVTDGTVESDVVVTIEVPLVAIGDSVIPPTRPPSSASETQSPSSSSFVSTSSQSPTANAEATQVGQGPGDEEKSESLSPGVVAVIAISSVAVVFVSMFVATRKRDRNSVEDPALQDVKNLDGDLEAGQPSKTMKKDEDGSSSHNAALVEEDRTVGDTLQSASAISATPLFSGNSPEKRGKCSSVDQEMESSSRDDSSSAGASGWSSSAGLSSLNTATFDTLTDDEGMTPSHGSMLAAIGTASAITHTIYADRNEQEPIFLPVRYDEELRDVESLSSASDDVDKSSLGRGKVTRADLNAAIDAGDWAAVGATAALLANSSDHDSGAELRGDSVHTTESMISDLENSRTSELDSLVEAGDWQGVILAAAQFEGVSGAESFNQSRDRLDDEANLSSVSSGHTKRNMQEIRAEVETLVKRVVPDEIDNVDEMMVQFKGREDELIETLRTMLERNVAQRARAAVNKSARLEAKARGQASQSSPSNITRDRSHSLSSSDPDFYEGSDTSNFSDGDEDNSSSRLTNVSSLKEAVQRGDWETVGEVAAMIGDGSEIVANDWSSIVSSTSSHQERSATMNAMIAAGDWAGIVAAASQYQAMDEQSNSGLSKGRTQCTGSGRYVGEDCEPEQKRQFHCC